MNYSSYDLVTFLNFLDPPTRDQDLSPNTHALQYIRYGKWKPRQPAWNLPMDFPFKQEIDVTFHNNVFTIEARRFVYFIGKWEIK